MCIRNISIVSVYLFPLGFLANTKCGTGNPACLKTRYVSNNSLKEGKKRQDWSFVVPFLEREAARLAIPAEAMRAGKPARPIGGAALKSREESRRAAIYVKRVANDAAKTSTICPAFEQRSCFSAKP